MRGNFIINICKDKREFFQKDFPERNEDKWCTHYLELYGSNNYYAEQDAFCICLGEVYCCGKQVNSTEAFFKYFLNYGLDCFRMMSGTYVAVVGYKKKVYCISGKTACPSLYYYFDKESKQFVVSTELKLFPKQYKQAIEFEKIFNISYKSRNITNIKDVYRVVPGTYVTVDYEEQLFEEVEYYSPLRSIDIFTKEDAEIEIRNCMDEYFDTIKDIEMSCLVSGGLDSSIIAMLSQKRCKKTELFCLGTELVNEFEPAQYLADSLGLKLEKYVVQNNDFVSYFAKTIELVEHSHSTFIEYLVPIVMAHEKLQGRTKNLISGYGSDILFAGFANKDMTLADISKLVHGEYMSTNWSNETSQNLGMSYGINVFYPYFYDRLIDTSFRISPELKYYNNIEKYILRYAYRNDLLKDIVWRKKVGVHQGTGLENFMTKLLKGTSNTTIRKKKDMYAYRIFNEVIINERKISEIDTEEILHEI